VDNYGYWPTRSLIERYPFNILGIMRSTKSFVDDGAVQRMVTKGSFGPGRDVISDPNRPRQKQNCARHDKLAQSRLMSSPPFQAIKGYLPLPTAERKGLAKDTVFPLLESMEVGEMQEVNRGRRASNAYCYRFKKVTGSEKVFAVRSSPKPGWSRIWRVK
jgi:hypothetical protein